MCITVALCFLLYTGYRKYHYLCQSLTFIKGSNTNTERPSNNWIFRRLHGIEIEEKVGYKYKIKINIMFFCSFFVISFIWCHQCTDVILYNILLFDVYRSDFPTTSLGSNHNIQTLITSYGTNMIIKVMINLIVYHPMTFSIYIYKGKHQTYF